MTVARTEALAWQLERDNQGQLVYVAPDGTRQVGVVPVRAFPLYAPEEGLSIVGVDGHELVWLDNWSTISPTTRALLQEELAWREFIPHIVRLNSVSTFATPSSWSVVTDRGEATLILRSEDDIRRLRDGRLLIVSSHGVQFMILDRFALDRTSQRLLERFL